MWVETTHRHAVHVASGSHWVLVSMVHSGARRSLSVIHTGVAYNGLLSYEVLGPRVRATDVTLDLRSCRLEATA